MSRAAWDHSCNNVMHEPILLWGAGGIRQAELLAPDRRADVKQARCALDQDEVLDGQLRANARELIGLDQLLLCGLLRETITKGAGSQRKRLGPCFVDGRRIHPGRKTKEILREANHRQVRGLMLLVGKEARELRTRHGTLDILALAVGLHHDDVGLALREREGDENEEHDDDELRCDDPALPGPLTHERGPNRRWCSYVSSGNAERLRGAGGHG